MKVPEKWRGSEKTVKAIQVAFELEQHIAQTIREQAVRNGLRPSDQIRKILALDYSPPKRPRLTVSLAPDDYKQLGERYGVDPADTLEIKRHIVRELIKTVA
ncbi:MAG: hypothetical protein ACE5EM_11365 [Sphingomonadales bacterium]